MACQITAFISARMKSAEDTFFILVRSLKDFAAINVLLVCRLENEGKKKRK